MESLIRVRGRTEAAELPHGPWPAPIHAGIDAARVGRNTRITQVVVVIELLCILRRIELLDGYARDGREGLVALDVLFCWISDVFRHFLSPALDHYTHSATIGT